MSNTDNLINLRDRTPEERREIARRGGLAAQAKIRQRKSLREQLEILLSMGDVQEKLCNALLEAALNGNVSAFNSIRDTTGEVPRVNVAADVTARRFGSVEEMTPEQLEIARQFLLEDNALGEVVSGALSVEAKEEILESLL